jgi:hypothetical protein
MLMARLDGRDCEAEPAAGPVAVEVEISRVPEARRRSKPTTTLKAAGGLIAIFLLLAAAIGGAVVGSRDHDPHGTARSDHDRRGAAQSDHDRRGAAQREPVAARDAGPSGVAAAYRHPLRCLSVTFASVDPAFARADFNRSSPCGRYDGPVTAIFRRTRGSWQPVLDAGSYACPIASLPGAVQRALAVCP